MSVLPVPSWAHGTIRQRRVVWRVIEEHQSSSTHPKCAAWLGASWTLSSSEFECAATKTTLAADLSAHWLQICEACVPCSLICHHFVSELISCPMSAIPYAPFSRYLPARCSKDKDSLWFARISRRCADRVYFFSSGHLIDGQYFYILSPLKDILFPQCPRSTLVTLPAHQIQNILLTLRA